MNERQRSFFDPPTKPKPPALPYAKGSATSKAAAESMRAKAPRQRERVYRYIQANPGTTREQIAEGLTMKESSVTSCVFQLVKLKNVRVLDNLGVTRAGNAAERLMASAKPFAATIKSDARAQS